MARVLTDEEQAQHERIHGRFGDAHEPVGDARAQLWVGMYLMRHWQFGAEHARACDFADAAVRDFDEHYLGGKR